MTRRTLDVRADRWAVSVPKSRNPNAAVDSHKDPLVLLKQYNEATESPTNHG
ncbi:MAG TPA: hypothetical protein V6C50_00950 [Crinalium sp.]